MMGCAAMVLLCYPDFHEQFSTHLWSWATQAYQGGDLGGTLFLVGRGLLGEQGDSSRLLAWPEGFDFKGAFSNTLCTDLMGIPVRLLGMPLGYNLSILAILASNGLAVHVAARALGARRIPALLAGAVVPALPPFMDEVLSGRPVSAWWAPSILGFALFLGALRSWRQSLLLLPAIALLLLGSLNYGYHPLLLLPWMALAGLFALFPLERGRWARVALGVALGVCALLLLLRVVPEGEVRAHLVGPVMEQEHMDLLHLFYMGQDKDFLLRIPGTLIPLTLVACLFSWRSWTRWLPALVAASLLILVSLGSNYSSTSPLAVAQEDSFYSMIVGSLPILWGCPRATRYGMAGLLCLGIALGVALSASPRPGLRRPLYALLLVLTFTAIVSKIPFGTRVHAGLPWPPLPAMELMRDEPLLLDLPLVLGHENVSTELVGYVPVPRLNPPIGELAGWRARLSLDQRPLLLAATVVDDGKRPSEELLSSLRENIPERDLGLRRVVVHNRRASFQQSLGWAELFEGIGAKRIFTDPVLTIYKLPDRPYITSSPDEAITPSQSALPPSPSTSTR